MLQCTPRTTIKNISILYFYIKEKWISTTYLPSSYKWKQVAKCAICKGVGDEKPRT
jgi:hypothetical protein